MKILVVGKGGREHALLLALASSPSAPELYVSPGSDAMEGLAVRLPAATAEELVERAVHQGIDLVVAGEEAWLARGLGNLARAAGLRMWGPDRDGAALESSKAFAKAFMERHRVPTARATVAETVEEARAAIDGYPVVLKFDGLAAGKGVVVCPDAATADDALDRMLVRREFGPGPVLVEEFMTGKELSVICAVADADWQVFTPARDYKRQQDGDRGPNTGGMGSVASIGLIEANLLSRINREIVGPTVDGLVRDGISYRGFLYVGLMLTPDGPRVVEYNVRFGDPEAQAILPLVGGDFAEFLYQAAGGEIARDLITLDEGWAVCVVLASRDYPRSSGDGGVIEGLDQVPEVQVIHSGTRRNTDGRFEVHGGRVLGLVARAPTREQAVARAHAAAATVTFPGAQHRTDIGRLHFE